jgi:hypothetical protein
VRCISMGAPPLSWVQDGRAGGEPAGQAPWARTGLDNLNLLSVNNEDMASVRRDRTHALADRIDGCRGRPVQFVAQDYLSRRLRGRAMAPRSTGSSATPANRSPTTSTATCLAFVNGQLRSIPYGIGFVAPVAKNPAQDAFAGASHCYYWLHVHAGVGIIHIESPYPTDLTHWAQNGPLGRSLHSARASRGRRGRVRPGRRASGRRGAPRSARRRGLGAAAGRC